MDDSVPHHIAVAAGFCGRGGCSPFLKNTK